MAGSHRGARSPCGQVGWRGAQSLRGQVGWRGFVAYRFYRGGFLDFARNDNRVRNLLSLPPRGKVDCRSVAKARRMRGKRRYVFIRFYSPHSPLGSLRLHSCHLPPRGKALAVNCLRRHFDRSEDNCPNAVDKSHTIEVYCSCPLVFISVAGDFSAVSHRGRAGWRVFVSDISLPGDCHVAATSRLVA